MPETTTTLPQGNEDYESKLKAWESEKKGIVRDLQGEREKRHALEKRLEELEAHKESLTRQEEYPAEITAKINKFASDPDKYIQEAVKPIIASERKERELEKAYEWAAKQLEKDFEDIRYGEENKSFVRIANEYNIDVLSDPRKGIKTVLKIYKQEQKDKELEEQGRTEKIQENSPERVKLPARQGTRRWTRQDILGMNDSEYLKYKDEIDEAERTGQIL